LKLIALHLESAKKDQTKERKNMYKNKAFASEVGNHAEHAKVHKTNRENIRLVKLLSCLKYGRFVKVKYC